MKHFLLMAALGLSLVSCHTNRLLNNPEAVEIISMTQSACYGFCPNYELRIFSDGSLEFLGRNFTEAEGLHKGQISKKALKKWVKAFENPDFFAYSQDYSEPRIPDLQVITLRYQRPEGQKIVKFNPGHPEDLAKLAQELHQLAVEKKWIDLNRKWGE
jgi:hypothetical protein